MKDWNVIVTIFQDGFRHAMRALRRLGPVEHSPYHNVLLMAAEDPIALLDAIERQNEPASLIPLVLVPAFLVPVSVLLHLASLRKLHLDALPDGNRHEISRAPA